MVTLCTLVSTFFAVTFTPETAAPVESVTVPRIEVDVVCANSSAHTRSDVPTNRRLFMLILSRKMSCNKNIRSGRKCQYKDTGGPGWGLGQANRELANPLAEEPCDGIVDAIGAGRRNLTFAAETHSIMLDRSRRI